MLRAIESRERRETTVYDHENFSLSRFALRSDSAAALNNPNISIHGVVVSINAFHVKQALESGSIPDGCISFPSTCPILFPVSFLPVAGCLKAVCTLPGTLAQASPLCLVYLLGYIAHVKKQTNRF